MEAFEAEKFPEGVEIAMTASSGFHVDILNIKIPEPGAFNKVQETLKVLKELGISENFILTMDAKVAKHFKQGSSEIENQKPKIQP